VISDRCGGIGNCPFSFLQIHSCGKCHALLGKEEECRIINWNVEINNWKITIEIWKIKKNRERNRFLATAYISVS
jgi:hypothetical protein